MSAAAAGRRHFGRMLALGLFVLALAALTLTAGRGLAQETAEGLPGLDSGAGIYAHICQGCHMPDGTGASGAGHYPALAGDRALASWQYVAITVLNGRKAMPPFGSWASMGPLRLSAHLSDAQVAQVVNYVRTHFGNQWKEHVSAAEVKALPHPQTEQPRPLEPGAH